MKINEIKVYYSVRQSDSMIIIQRGGCSNTTCYLDHAIGLAS